jgi:cytochrome c peroxidase
MRIWRWFLFITVMLLSMSFDHVINGTGSVNEPTPFVLDYSLDTLGYPNIPANNPLTVEGVKLGRLLFYDPILSSNNEMSCGTCHIQSKAFTDGKVLAVGTYQDTLSRNTMSLVNLAWSTHFFWDGREKSLEQLVREPVTNAIEMAQDTTELVDELNQNPNYPKLFHAAFPDQEISMELVSKAIAQFLRTIISNGVKLNYNELFEVSEQYYDERTESEIIAEQLDIEQEESLRGTFTRLAKMCTSCHGGPIYGNELMANNNPEATTMRMKAPSLVNIMHTAPYMHDGRFETLTEVLQHYSEHFSSLGALNPGLKITTNNQLLSYDIEHAEEVFELFDDKDLISDKSFSDPFNDDFDWSEY